MSKKISTIAKNIKRYRRKMNISQDKLSKLAGLSLQTIAKIELGFTPDPRVGSIKKIAGALNISVDDLIK